MTVKTTAFFPPANSPLVDSDNRINNNWYHYLLSLYYRTGAATGVSATALSTSVTASQLTGSSAQTTADEAKALASQASSTANTGVTNAAGSQVTANQALSLANNLNTTAVLKSNFQYDGIAPLDSPEFSGAITMPIFINAANDAAAAALGVGIGQLYRIGSVVAQRCT